MVRVDPAAPDLRRDEADRLAQAHGPQGMARLLALAAGQAMLAIAARRRNAPRALWQDPARLPDPPHEAVGRAPLRHLERQVVVSPPTKSVRCAKDVR